MAPRRFLFHDCDPQTQQWAVGTVRLFNPGRAVYQHAPGPLPLAVSCGFILPAGDRTLRPDWMHQAARQRDREHDGQALQRTDQVQPQAPEIP